MATTTNFGWETPDDTDLVKDGALAMRTLGNSIDTSFVDLKGGTTGQVLSKASNTDLDFTWVAQDDSNAIQNAIIDAKGDLIVGTAADTPARLAVGTNGHVLTADSTTASGLKWAAAAGGGKVLQVVAATYSTTQTTTSSTYADSNLTATITPSSASSKVLVMIDTNGILGTGSTNARGGLRLLRGATVLSYISTGLAYFVGGGGNSNGGFGASIAYLDTPATTSATTYKTQVNNNGGAGTIYFQFDDGTNGTTSSIVLLEIGA